MKIGIDLDSVLVDMTPLLQKACNETGFKFQHPIDWKFSNYPEETKNLIYQYFSDEKEMCNLKLFPGVKEKISNLLGEGHEIYIITARNQKMNNEKYIHRLFDDKTLFGYGLKIFVVGFNEPKVNILIENNIPIWIDDCPNELENIQNAGIHVIMISNEMTIYNWHKRLAYDWYYYFIDIPFNDLNKLYGGK